MALQASIISRRRFLSLASAALGVVPTSSYVRAASSALVTDDTRIRPFSDRPWFWQFRGEPVLLLGGTGEDNLFNHPEVDGEPLERHLDRLVAAGGNYVRNTMSDRDQGNVYAFARKGEGYDLGRWNPEYWRRFERFLDLTAERGIIVQIELWDMWDLTREGWDRHPFNPLNNLNYSADESGLLTAVPFDPAEEPTDHTFFHTVPELDDNDVVLPYQQAFVDRVLETSLTYPNVLYCINNESGEPPGWSRYWAARVHERAREQGVEAQVTDMRRKEDVTHETHRIVYDARDVYTFADVSQNTGHQITDRNLQYRRLLNVRDYLATDPRPINNVKIYNDHLGGAPKFMRNVFAGLAASRFHRPTRGLGLSEEAEQILRSVRDFTSALDWFGLSPCPDLLGDTDGVYLMAEPGRQYALAFDGGGATELDARALPSPAELRWMRFGYPGFQDGGRVEPGRIKVTAPDDGLWMAMIRA